jgi:AAA+ superfamily predicted ATPase
MDTVRDLRLLLTSRHPLIVAAMDDEARFMAFVRRAAELCALPVWTWSVTRGLVRDGHGIQANTADAIGALAFIRELSAPAVFVFHDLRGQLGDATLVRHLKEFAMAAPPDQTVILSGPDATVPPELAGLALPWTLEPPSRLEVEELVRTTLDDLAGRGLAVTVTDEDVGHLVHAGLGLTLPALERLLIREAMTDGVLDGADVARVRTAKSALLADDGVLELVATDVDLDDVGGLEALKEWLRVRGRGFEQAAREFGLEAPRGVLLTGVPGGGKSLVAKCVARAWRMPLVLLDPGAIYAAYVGESEARLRSALATVEAMAPVVLWVDEIEKGLAAGGGTADSGVSRRVLGAFLRWLQERPEGVFLIATCNDVAALPPELLRRGRFDEMFFVDLPSDDERRAILALHLRRRDRDPADFALDGLVDASEGFTGAELEGAVVGGLYRAYAANEEVTTRHVAEELAATVPLSRTRAEDIARLRAWADGRAVRASGSRHDVDPDPGRRQVGYA